MRTTTLPRVARPRSTHTRRPPRRRGTQYAAAYRFCLLSLEYWVTRPSAQLRTRRVTTTECVARSLFIKHTFAISRRVPPEVFHLRSPLLEYRGRREDRVRAAPAVSCAIAHKDAHTSIQVQRRASGLPCAMVLRRTSCSSRCANSFSHRHPRIDGWGQPGRAGTSSADLTPATGARTTRLGRTRHAQRQNLDGLGTHPPKFDEERLSIGRRRAVPSLTKPQRSPPCDDVCAPDAAASTAPGPALSDDRETPLLGDGIPEVVRVIWGKREADYFCRRSFFDLRCRANQCWARREE
ncbi:hypothetical protein V1293_004986 [Bradyrhizobium sp. AZCC 1693]